MITGMVGQTISGIPGQTITEMVGQRCPEYSFYKIILQNRTNAKATHSDTKTKAFEWNDQVELVMANITLVSCKPKAKALQRSLLTYYENNLCRMKYKTYRQQGMLIGSGPVEAAHRHVIQARLKRSGQRWTLKGAQQVANLRTAHCSGNWKIVKA